MNRYQELFYHVTLGKQHRTVIFPRNVTERKDFQSRLSRTNAHCVQYKEVIFSLHMSYDRKNCV